MTTNTFYATVDNKSHVFIRTESRFFDITTCRMLTDGVIPNRDGLIPESRPVSNEFVADKVAKSAKAKVKRSMIRRFRKEEAV